MKSPTFRGKPSGTHVIWRRNGSGDTGAKVFDETELRGWCSKFALEYETDKRVDHDRGEEPRKQYRCIFAWTEAESQSFEMGDEEWNIETQQTPQTFVEIDDCGVMRVKSRDDEHVVDVHELWLEEGAILFRPAGSETATRLKARKLRRTEQ